LLKRREANILGQGAMLPTGYFMKKYAFYVVVYLTGVSAYGQNDSLRNEILRYQDTKSEIISKGRKLLLDAFMQEDFGKVKEVKGYLVTTAKDDFVAFYPYEYLLLSYWTQEFDIVIASPKNIDSLESTLRPERIRPQRDLLFEKVFGKTIGSMIELESSIGLSELAPIDNRRYKQEAYKSFHVT
jgi:hypothetical protein